MNENMPDGTLLKSSDISAFLFQLIWLDPSSNPADEF